MDCRMLLFDLDGTLLRSDRSISPRTLQVLDEYRKRGVLVGIATSRSESNSQKCIQQVTPDIEITCSGALIKYREEYVYKAEFTSEETKRLIRLARELCGSDTEITVDTLTGHYWNYKQDPKLIYHDWGECIHTDYQGVADSSLKICVQIFEADKAAMLAAEFPDCDCVKFMDGAWYKFTKKTATKECAINYLSKRYEIPLEQVIAFGDDLVDVGMLACCGMGVAMGNALDAVKEAADVVIGSNDEDGIAKFLEKMI